MVRALLVLLISAAWRSCLAEREYCRPCLSCWPSDDVIQAFNKTLTGYVIQPSEAEKFEEAAVAYNRRLYEHPGLIVEPITASDVKKAIVFGRTHNMRVVTKSSGHCLVGRSSVAGSLTIYLRKMRNITVNMADSGSDTGASLTAGPGANWIEIYEVADKNNRIINGGSSPTVAVGGYTVGGGHGPMSRTIGLGVDNTIAFEIVTADSQLRRCTSSGCVIVKENGETEADPNGGDLFWAVRGGGGSFGVVTSLTIKMHAPPPQFVHLMISWPIRHDDHGDVGKRFFKFYNEFVQTMPREWGGYLIMNNLGPVNTGASSYTGSIFLSLLYQGKWNDAVRSIQPLLKLEPESQLSQVMRNYSTFLEYERTVDDYAPYRLFLVGTLTQPYHLNDNFTQLMTDDVLNAAQPLGCTLIHVGGKITDMELSSSSIAEGWRGAIFSTGCSHGWESEYLDDYFKSSARTFNEKLQNFGKHMYYNEPSTEVVDWKTEFWYPNYDRLLQIKQAYDPDHVFTCVKCVGWDDVTNSTTKATSGEGFSYFKMKQPHE